MARRALLALLVLPLVAVPGRAGALTADTWTVRGTTGPARSYGVMAYDGTRTILFGGWNNGYLSDMWAWSGTAWTQQFPATLPPARNGAAMAYDAARHQVVLFGGYQGAFRNDTWTWDGTTWTSRSPATSPSPRDDAAMAYDAARGEVVLFGGSNASGNFADTWTWNGSTWTQHTPAASPPARSQAALAYDAANGVTTLFGGAAAGAELGDTWTWNGVTWTQASLGLAPIGPPPRHSAVMSYDARLGVTVLFGGEVSSGLLNDTWTWDGSRWLPATTTASPLPRARAMMAFDAGRGETVLFGGEAGGAALPDTWVYQRTTLPFTPPPNNLLSHYQTCDLYAVGDDTGGMTGLLYASYTPWPMPATAYVTCAVQTGAAPGSGVVFSATARDRPYPGGAVLAARATYPAGAAYLCTLYGTDWFSPPYAVDFDPYLPGTQCAPITSLDVFANPPDVGGRVDLVPGTGF